MSNYEPGWFYDAPAELSEDELRSFSEKFVLAGAAYLWGIENLKPGMLEELDPYSFKAEEGDFRTPEISMFITWEDAVGAHGDTDPNIERTYSIELELVTHNDRTTQLYRERVGPHHEVWETAGFRFPLVKGENPIAYHEYFFRDKKGKDVRFLNDMQRDFINAVMDDPEYGPRGGDWLDSQDTADIRAMLGVLGVPDPDDKKAPEEMDSLSSGYN